MQLVQVHLVFSLFLSLYSSHESTGECEPKQEPNICGDTVGLVDFVFGERHCVQRIALGQFKYVHSWQDHLLEVSLAPLKGTLGLALESGQIRRSVLVSVLGRSQPEWESGCGQGSQEFEVMMGRMVRGARHMVHLTAEGQFS